MKNKTLRLIVFTQLTVLTLFLGMTLLNEILDLPHFLFGDAPTPFGQRLGEMYVELAIFFLIMGIELVLLRKFYKRIRLLEGFLPICANCKKIRSQGEWEPIEKYISEHSLARFTHSLCPNCAVKLYPEIYPTQDPVKKGP